MNKNFLTVLLLLAPFKLVSADAQWVLRHSTLAYHVSHTLHQVDGISHDARGKGVCQSGQCDFLIAVPVKSFDSGDSNRDLHMLQVTRGAQFPIVSVRTRLPETVRGSATIQADLEIEFAGQKAQYKQIPFQVMTQGNEIHISGTIPATVSDFKIDPPKLLGIAIKNEIPVHVDMTWSPM
jgi:YceI-like protein